MSLEALHGGPPGSHQPPSRSTTATTTGSPLPADCKYGDHIDTCEVQDGRQCYNTTVLQQCCATCHGYETQIPDCKYGNKKPWCRVELCTNYTFVEKVDCCKTCKTAVDCCPSINNTQPGTTLSPWATWLNTTPGPGAVTRGLENKADNESLPVWVVPTISTGGFALFVLIVILAVFIIRRSWKSKAAKSSGVSIATVDSRLSNRAPVPAPRPNSTKSDDVRERAPSAEYDYIDPEYSVHAGSNTPGLAARNKDDPLPLAPREYLTWDDPNGPYRRVLCSKEPSNSAKPTIYTSAPENSPFNKLDVPEGKVVPNGRHSPYEATEYAHLESSQREARRDNLYRLFPTLKVTDSN